MEFKEGLAKSMEIRGKLERIDRAQERLYQMYEELREQLEFIEKASERQAIVRRFNDLIDEGRIYSFQYGDMVIKLLSAYEKNGWPMVDVSVTEVKNDIIETSAVEALKVDCCAERSLMYYFHRMDVDEVISQFETYDDIKFEIDSAYHRKVCLLMRSELGE